MKLSIILLITMFNLNMVVASTTPKKEEKKKLTDYEKLFDKKEVKTSKGFLTLHQVEDKVYVEIPFSEFNKDLMLASVVSEISDHTDCHPGVAPMIPMKVAFERIGETINLTRDKSISMGDGDENIEKAIDRSNIGAVFASFKIKAYNADSTAAVVDMTSLMTGDQRMLSPIHARSESKLMMRGVTYRHYKDGCSLKDVSAFDNNVTISSTMTYTSKVNTYTRYTTAVVDRMFVKLPETEMPKHEADFRMPLQVIGRLRFNGNYKGADEYYYALKWRLEPVDQAAFDAGKGSEVKKPIVFYMDTTFTDIMKQGIIEGIGEWNKTFEAAGYKNAIQFKDYPKDDPNFDPANFAYNVIRYVPSLSDNAYVKTFADPRSGEILRTTIGICYNYMHKLPYDIFLQTAHADPSVRTRYPSDERLKDEVKYHFMWLAGVDCFGLTYNLTSSAAFHADSLRTASFTQKYGTSPSMLDMARHNTVAPIDGVTKGVRVLPTGVGEFDYFAYEWLYGMPGTDKKAIQARRQMVDKVQGNPIYRYEYAKNAPDCGAGDVGHDDLIVAGYQLENLRFMLHNFDKWISDEEDKKYEFRGTMYQMLTRRYKQILTQVALNVYGIKTYQRMSDDPVPAYEYMSKERQQKAIDMLFEHIVRPDWMFRDDIVETMTLARTTEEEHKDYLMLLMNVTASSLFAYDAAPGDQIRHADFVRQQVKRMWQSTREGKELTPYEIYFQNFIARTLCRSSKMEDVKVKEVPVASSSNGVVDFSANDKMALLTELHGQLDALNYDEEHPLYSAKYGELKKWPVINTQSSRYVYLALIKDIRQWMGEQITDDNTETQQHYRYLVDMIDRLMD